MGGIDALTASLKSLLPRTSLVRLVMNHWHDDTGEQYGCEADAPPFITPHCLELFERVVSWATEGGRTWVVITGR